VEAAPPPKVPFGRLMADHPGAVLAGIAGVVACFAIFYLATTFALSFATTKLGYAKQNSWRAACRQLLPRRRHRAGRLVGRQARPGSVLRVGAAHGAGRPGVRAGWAPGICRWSSPRWRSRCS
jgi:hypothetical protein